MLNEDSVKEGKVCQPKVWIGFDWDWFRSVPIWYLGLWSKLDLYRTAAALTELKISEIKEADVLAANVIWNAETSKLSGFGVKDVDSALEFDEEKRLIFGEDRHYYLFSDNKSYIFGVTCWTDGEQSWGLWSTRKDISPEIKEKALEHAKQLGFNPKLSVETTFTV